MDNRANDSGIEGYLTVKEAALKLGLSYKSVQRHVKNGHLKGTKKGGVYLISQREINNFKPNLAGRPRASVPQWRFSYDGNEQIATSVEGELREGVSEEDFTLALEQIKRGEEYQFAGTIARYILSNERAPHRVQFLLIWRQSVMPPAETIESTLAAMQSTLGPVLDWQTARIDTCRVWMHT